jgi:TetR/AcrR family transcriptional repressor of nem operon
VLEPLAAPGGGLAAIEHYFEDTARRMASPPLRACLMVNSVVELAPHDEAVAALTADFVCRLQQAFAQALDVAVLQQELVVDDIQAEAWRLTSAGLGLSTLSKAGTPPQTLLSVARQVLASMRSGHGST